MVGHAITIIPATISRLALLGLPSTSLLAQILTLFASSRFSTRLGLFASFHLILFPRNPGTEGNG